MKTDDHYRLESQRCASESRDSQGRTAPITSEVLAQWDSELDEFFAQTRSKLRALVDTSAVEPLPDAPQTSTVPAADPWPAPDANASDESLDRLQQVKRRLAARLEKSRSIEQAPGHTRETDSRPLAP